MNFKRYIEASDTWVDSHYIKKTDTDIITTLPATIYPLAQTATLGLKGNTVQNGTPTPSNPVEVNGVGTLDNGQYKIPILCGGVTTDVYLGELETTRYIKKLALTGTERWIAYSGNYFSSVIDSNSRQHYLCFCTHLESTYSSGIYVDSGSSRLKVFSASVADVATTVSEWKTYLQQQYAAGTPVTVWYVLATEETGIVNEPLQKIGDYADEVSGITIPVTAGANTISVGTTLQPSEVTANYHGWHPVQSVHEAENGQWD